MKKMLLIAALTCLLAGCNEGQQAQTYTGPAPSPAASTAAADNLTRLACASEKAHADAGEDPEKNMEVLRLMRDVNDLEAAGYGCSDKELRESSEQAVRKMAENNRG